MKKIIILFTILLTIIIRINPFTKGDILWDTNNFTRIDTGKISIDFIYLNNRTINLFDFSTKGVFLKSKLKNLIEKNKEGFITFYMDLHLLSEEDFNEISNNIYFYSKEVGISKIEKNLIIEKKKMKGYLFYKSFLYLKKEFKKSVDNNELYFGIIQNYDETKKEEYIKDFVKLNTQP